MPCFGRGDGDRTHDLSVPNAARYQLRYASPYIKERNYYNKSLFESQSFFPSFYYFLSLLYAPLRNYSPFLLLFFVFLLNLLYKIQKNMLYYMYQAY